jgi:uncharacterized paraquat-inducible protein A
VADVRFLCPECGAKLSVPSAAVGKYGDCPQCRRAIQLGKGRLLDIRFSCPACQGHLAVDLSAAGRQAPCPLCRVTIRIPAAPPEPQPAPARPLVELTAEEIEFLSGDTHPR